MVLPYFIELDQEILVVLSFEKISIRKNVAFNGICDFFVKLLPVFIDDESVRISVEFFKRE